MRIQFVRFDSRYMPLGVGRLRSRSRCNARLTCRSELSPLPLWCFSFLVSSTSPLVPYFMRASLSRQVWVLVCVGRLRFRRGRLSQVLLSFPSFAGLCPFSSASAFLLPCLFRVCPLRTRCFGVVFSSSPLLCFAFPFLCPA